MIDQIRAQVQSIIDCASVTFSVVYLCQRKLNDWDCDEWCCEFSSTLHPPEKFQYFTGLGLRSPAPKPRDGGRPPCRNTLMWEQLEKQRRPLPPHPADVLHSLILGSNACEMSFESWCREFGYSSDSIQAKKIYDECQRNTDKLHRLFSRETIEMLREVLQEY